MTTLETELRGVVDAVLYDVEDAVGITTTSDHGEFDPPCLTPRQMEIATLVSQGLANKQIAHLLMISVSAVEKHLSSVFERLNMGSRTQIAVWVAIHG